MIRPRTCLLCDVQLVNDSFIWRGNIKVYIASDSEGNVAAVCEDCYPTYREKVNPIITESDIDEFIDSLEKEPKDGK